MYLIKHVINNMDDRFYEAVNVCHTKSTLVLSLVNMNNERSKNNFKAFDDWWHKEERWRLRRARN